MAYYSPYQNGYNHGPVYPPPRQDMAGYAPQSPQQAQQISGGINTLPGYTCRPVASRLEAEAAQVDFFGPGTIMPDLAHGAIYLKRFNPNTGASDFAAFTVQPPAPEPEPVQYATIQDLQKLREELLKGAAGSNDAV